MSRASSIRVATVSRIERAEPVPSCARAPPRSQERRQGGEHSGRPGELVPGAFEDEALDPDHRTHELEHLPETGQDADDEDQPDEAVQPGIGEKDRRNLREGDVGADANQQKNDDHQNDLTDGLGELRLGLAVQSVHNGRIPTTAFLLLATIGAWAAPANTQKYARNLALCGGASGARIIRKSRGLSARASSVPHPLCPTHRDALRCCTDTRRWGPAHHERSR